MRILMLSTDTHALTAGTRVERRLAAIRARAGVLDVRVYDRRTGLLGLIAFVRKAAAHRGQYDVITSQDPFFFGVLGVVLSLWHKVPLNVQLHTDATSTAFIFSSVRHAISYVLMYIVIRFAHTVRTVSSRAMRALQPYTRARISVLPIVIDPTPFVTPHEKPDALLDAPVVIAVSRLTAEKRVDLSIRALTHVPGAHLYIIGDGPLRGVLHKVCVESGVADRVHFLGWIEDVAPYFQHADCVVHTAAYEGYGMVLVEALLAGTRVVTTDVGVAGELPPEYVSIVAPNEQQIAEAVRAAIASTANVVYDGVIRTDEEYADQFIATLL